MPKYRIGALNLPPTEVLLVRTLLRLFSHDSTFNWEFVDKAPYDVMLLDADAPSDHLVGGSPPARAILKLSRTVQLGDPNCLARPLRADQLSAWLKRSQIEIAGTASADSATGTQPHPPTDPPKPEKNNAIDDQQAYKLKRWPPITLLQKDPMRIRMATMLSRRFLKLQELANLTGLAREEIYSFVHKLELVGLLEIRRDTPINRISAQLSDGDAPPNPHNTSRPATAPPAAKPSFGRGLILSIRKRFGL